MDKMTYNETLAIKQKDLERLLWEVFWSYSRELGLEGSEAEKEKKVALAEKMIPDFAESATALDLYFDYPVIHLFLTSLHLQQNFLKSDEVKNIMEVKGPDNNSKLALLVRGLKEKGVVWQS